MAPLPPSSSSAKPSARTLRLQRITGQIHHLAPPKTFRPGAATSDSFLESKRDKRLIKHSTFLSRIATSSSSASSSGISKSRKRSRGARSAAAVADKLSATLDSLADALPDLQDGEGGAEILRGKVRHKSLRSKKGALRRKERIVRGEMERFGVSMAKLSGAPEQPQQQQQQQQEQQEVKMDGTEPSTAATTTTAATSNRWAALRGYISATMEQNPAFANQQ